MKGAAFKWGALVVFCCGLAGPVLAGEVNVTDRDRSFRNFTRDTATVGDGRIRLEVRGFTLEDNRDVELNIAGLPIEKVQQDLTNSQPGTLPRVSRVQGGFIDLLGSYGLGHNAEIGFDVPYFIETIDVTDVNSGSKYSKNSQDVGDTILYGKFKRQMAEHCALALGMELSIPTGIEKKYFGTGELGFNPFISTRYQRGRLGGRSTSATRFTPATSSKMSSTGAPWCMGAVVSTTFCGWRFQGATLTPSAGGSTMSCSCRVSIST